MKFGKHYAAALQSLPDVLQRACIDYKAWKQRLRACGEDGRRCMATCALDNLEMQCATVDNCFKQEHKRLVECRERSSSADDLMQTCWTIASDLCSVLMCLCLLPLPENERGADVAFAPTQLLHFAHLNTVAVYKVCKKIRKRHGIAAPLEWLARTREFRTFAFMGGRQVTQLNMITRPVAAATDDQHECPVCMEALHTQQALILPCGHVLCMPCTLSLAGVSEFRGPWYQQLAFTPSSRASCPICRRKDMLKRTWDMCVVDPRATI